MRFALRHIRTAEYDSYTHLCKYVFYYVSIRFISLASDLFCFVNAFVPFNTRSFLRVSSWFLLYCFASFIIWFVRSLIELWFVDIFLFIRDILLCLCSSPHIYSTKNSQRFYSTRSFACHWMLFFSFAKNCYQPSPLNIHTHV